MNTLSSKIIRHRIKWYRLQAVEIIRRYSFGIFTLVLFLPGVAINENLNLLLKAFSHPFLEISSLNSPFLYKLFYVIILLMIFITWSQVQKKAISGGKITKQMLALPITKSAKNSVDLFILLLSNHLLWIIIIFLSLIHI